MKTTQITLAQATDYWPGPPVRWTFDALGRSQGYDAAGVESVALSLADATRIAGVMLAFAAFTPSERCAYFARQMCARQADATGMWHGRRATARGRAYLATHDALVLAEVRS